MKFIQLVFTMFLLNTFSFVCCQVEDDINDVKFTNRTPIYIIANMANTIGEAETFLTDGANGLQIDVQFSSAGVPKTTHHGFPCFCGRDCSKSDDFNDYLEFLSRTTTPGTKSYNQLLSIVFMNLKLGGLSRNVLYTAGENFAENVISYLYGEGKKSSRAWIILGLPDVRSFAFVRGFRDTFKNSNMKWHLERFGYSVQKFPRPDRLKAALLSAGITNHVWLGTGSSICKRNATPQRVIRLASEREIIRKFGTNFVDKVYSWTVDLPTNMRETLRLGIDAVITNKPNQLKIILKEAEFEPHLRMADSADVPWRWHVKSRNSKSDSDTKSEKNEETKYSLVLDEIEKELDALNHSADEERDEDEKALEKLFPDKTDDMGENTKHQDSFFDKLVARFKNLFT